jgi:putative transposase
MQRYTQWHNRTHKRSGHLWEDRFKSVIVEDGVAAKTIAAYIDLNPVRAGMVKDPAEYRWSSYGEAIGGGAKGNGKKARAGLVRALRAHKGVAADAALWANEVSREYRKLLMAGAVEKLESRIGRNGKTEVKRKRRGTSAEEMERENERAGEISMGRMLRCRVRYFTDGAVIGSRSFVNEAFASARERFGPKRKDGARKMRGNSSAAASVIWSLRDFRKGVD